MMRGLALLFIVSTSASASVDVVWQTTDQCPAPTGQIEGAGHAEVQLVPQDGGWQVTVLFFDPGGLRRVHAETCPDAIRAAKLLLQLGARTATAPTVEPVIEKPSTTSTPAPVELPWNVSLTGGAAFDIGTLPFVEPRFAISAALSHGLLRLVTDVRIGLPNRITSAASIHRAFEAQLAGCMNIGSSRVAFSPCAAASIGTWSAANTTLAVATAGPQLRLFANIFSNIEVGVLTGLRFNLVRPQPFDASGVLFTTSLISADLQLTLGWRW